MNGLCLTLVNSIDTYFDFNQCILLSLQKFGLKVHIRDSHSFTPLLEEPGPNGRPRHLLLGRDEKETHRQIAQFSKRDAEVSSLEQPVPS